MEKPFIVSDILRSAWQACFDSKAAIWLPAIIIAALTIVVGLIVLFGLKAAFFGTNTPANMLPQSGAFVLQLINTFLVSIVIAPYVTGMLMVAIKRARNEEVTTRTGLQYISSWLKLGAINIMITIFGMIIDLFFVLILSLIAGGMGANQSEASAHANGVIIVVSIIMMLCYITFYAFVVFALPSAVDKNKSVWEALSHGARIVTPHWLKMVGIEILIGIIATVSFIPLILGTMSHAGWLGLLGGVITLLILIWILPFIVLIHGQAYQRLSN